MCGLTGFFSPQGFHQADAVAVVARMRDTLAHRGPDDAGSWLDGESGIALAHRRLSILDLSPAGHQPMQSNSGRFVLVFNGEVYNHLDIRLKLEAACQAQTAWRGHSDTETLLAAIEQWGLEQTLRQCVGMFALALWDRRDRVLTLARDRMGEKPLYYGWQNGTLLFGSELKALQAHPEFCRQINCDVLPLYFRHGYIPAPWSIWDGVRKLTPGTFVTFYGAQINQNPVPIPYWSMIESVNFSHDHKFNGSDEDAADELERLLCRSIAGQKVADVPLGAFLSGGVDSSVVVALMQAQASRPVKTFTIGFEEKNYNEGEHAKAVARHIGTDHTELYLTSSQAQSLIPKLSSLYDEPFGDSSAIPTLLVSHLARQHVTVSLSGDGGDELFGGYSRYSGFQRWHRRTSWIPSYLRGILSCAAHQFPVGNQIRNLRRKEMLIGVLDARNPAGLYRALLGYWTYNNRTLPRTYESPYWLNQGALLMKHKETLDHAMMADMMTYLPDDILAKVDRAAMSVSLETRVPLLDHRIVEWSWTLPQRLKSRDGNKKWVLREVLYRYVPKELIEPPKMGFGVPIGVWLRGPMRDWVEDILSKTNINKYNLFSHERLKVIWHQHLEGRHDHGDLLWIILMLQVFLLNSESHSGKNEN